MSTFATLLTLHIICGFASLLSGIAATVTKIWDFKHIWHVWAGRVFYWGMWGVFLTALAMSLIRTNTFLLFVAIFSFYVTFMGWRYAKNRTGAATLFDQVFVIAGMVGAVAMLIAAGVAMSQGDPSGTIMLVFGIIYLLNTIQDLQNVFNDGRAKGKKRIAEHLGKMLGGMIATVTAFLVVNISTDVVALQILTWLAPTIILVPVIFIWTRKITAGVKRKGM